MGGLGLGPGGWGLGLRPGWWAGRELEAGGKGLKRQFEATLKMTDSSGGQFGLGVVVLWWSVLWSSWCSKL